MKQMAGGAKKRKHIAVHALVFELQALGLAPGVESLNPSNNVHRAPPFWQSPAALACRPVVPDGRVPVGPRTVGFAR